MKKGTSRSTPGEREIEARVAQLAALQAILLEITSAHELPEVLQSIVERATRLLGAPSGGLYQCDPERREVRCVVSYNMSRDYTGSVLKFGEGVAGKVAQTGQPMILDNYHDWSGRADIFKDDPHLSAIVSAPLLWRGEVTGVIHVLCQSESRRFTQADLELLTLFANHAAIAMENARLYGEMRGHTAQLQALSRRLVEVQEEERHAMARELHDEIGQTLTGLKILLEMALRLPPELASAKLEQAQTLASELIERVSRMSLNLRPPMLDDLGLLPALLWHLDRFTKQTGIQVDFKHSDIEGKRFAKEVETAGYRIMQESLTNIARHAGVKKASARLTAGNGVIKLQIEDRGRGMDAEAALAEGRGLAGMRERVRLVGGEFTVDSAPGRGARLEVRIPLRASRI